MSGDKKAKKKKTQPQDKHQVIEQFFRKKLGKFKYEDVPKTTQKFIAWCLDALDIILPTLTPSSDIETVLKIFSDVYVEYIVVFVNELRYKDVGYENDLFGINFAYSETCQFLAHLDTETDIVTRYPIWRGFTLDKNTRKAYALMDKVRIKEKEQINETT